MGYSKLFEDHERGPNVEIWAFFRVKELGFDIYLMTITYILLLTVFDN